MEIEKEELKVNQRIAGVRLAEPICILAYYWTTWREEDSRILLALGKPGSLQSGDIWKYATKTLTQKKK